MRNGDKRLKARSGIMRIIKRFPSSPYWKQRGRHFFVLQEAAFFPILHSVCLSLLSRFPLLSLRSIGLSQGQSHFSHSHSLPASLVLSCRLISGSSVIGLLANWPAGCQTQQRPIAGWDTVGTVPLHCLKTLINSLSPPLSTDCLCEEAA